MSTPGGKRTRAALAAAALAAAMLLAAPAFAQESIGVVKRAKGEVLLERGGVRMSAAKGLALLRGDRLITGRDAYAYVDIRGAAPLAVGPETRVQLDRFVPDSRVSHRSAPRLLQGLYSYFAINRQR